MKWCWRCQKVKTNRLIDHVPVCDACLLNDSKGGRITKDYSKMKKPQKVIDKEREREIALDKREKELNRREAKLKRIKK